MLIGVTSENALKVDAVKEVYALTQLPFDVVGYSTNSGVGEQPVNDETLFGARNRIADLQRRVGDLDRIVSIESGIFLESGQWVDRAMTVILDVHTGIESIGISEGVVFPTQYVDVARQLGFITTTVGKVMADAKYIANPKDPHLSIAGKTRRLFIIDALKENVLAYERSQHPLHAVQSTK